jgi:hypothetical protein
MGALHPWAQETLGQFGHRQSVACRGAASITTCRADTRRCNKMHTAHA